MMCGTVLTGPASLVTNEAAVGACCEGCADSHREMGIYDREIGRLIGLLTNGEEVGQSSAGGDVYNGVWAFTSNYMMYHLHQERLLTSLRSFLTYVGSICGREEKLGNETSYYWNGGSYRPR